jgi:Arc/MetJ-type ribon-helix-helix transcriptional regulator
MARKLTTTVRLDPEDAQALARAREDGLSASDLVRKGLRIVASRYYDNRRPLSKGLFVSTDLKLGEESELFKDLKR